MAGNKGTWSGWGYGVLGARSMRSASLNVFGMDLQSRWQFARGFVPSDISFFFDRLFLLFTPLVSFSVLSRR